jgi:hypothetical protein
VQTAKPNNITVPKELHEDLDIEMYMIVDGCYVKIFEDEKIYDIISVD